MYTPFVILSVLPLAFAHIGLWHPSVFGFNGDGYTLVEPMSGLSFNEWWFHGNLDKKPTGPPMSLPAGGKVTLELACEKRYTSYGNEGSGNSACPRDTNSYHAGNPLDPNQLLGCGLAIAYKDDATKVQPEDFTIFTVNDQCVNALKQDFAIPAGMPACPNGKCICAWFWQGQDSQDEMYMTGFECKVDGATGNTPVGRGQPPKFCPTGSGCVSGPKQPLYWANDRSNINFSGEYHEKPSYNSKWGFKNGAQNDIFAGTNSAETNSADTSSTNPTVYPTTLVTKTRPIATPTSSGPSATGKCYWPGHCAGASCANNEDCSGTLSCKSGKCAE